jgi:3-dehydroquinate dehydratase-2
VLGRPLSSLDEELVTKGEALGLRVETFQASGEAALLDALLERREGLFGVIVNPASIGPVCFSIADAVEALALPCIEVQLKHDAKSRGRSALKRVVEKQFHGHGVDGYFKALSSLAKQQEAAPVEAKEEEPTGEEAAATPSAPPRGKTIGRQKAAPSDPAAKGKTIGKVPGKSIGKVERAAATTVAAGAITRALVRDQITARLKKTLSPDEFAQWARSQWAAIQRGVPAEDPRLEDVLLLLSTSAKASDHVILSYAAKLES